MSRSENTPSVGDTADDARLAAAFAGSDAAAAAQRWLEGDRPEQLRKLTRALATTYQSLENSSPPTWRFGSLGVDGLAPSNALHATWPTTTLVLRQLMLVASRLYKSLGVLVAGSGSDLTASMPVVGRALQESVSLMDWSTRPIAAAPGSPDAAHLVGRRCFLLETAGIHDLLRESRDFQMADIDDLERALGAAREQGRTLFGESAHLDKDDTRSWSIEGEGIPGARRRVEDTGAYVFSANRRPATHYHGPSMSAHGSLGASLGAYTYVDHGERSHHAFVLQVDAVEKWVWYYTIWYRFAVERCALVHEWDSGRLDSDDRAARQQFGRSIAPSAP